MSLAPSAVFTLALLALALPASAQPNAGGGAVTLETLLREMTDRDALTSWPQTPYRTAQASSHDRASTSPADVATWFANGDRNQFVRTETRAGRQEYVLMEQDGPGAIVRLWFTWIARDRPFRPGTLRVYLDGADAPAIEGSLQKLLDGGGLVGPPLGHAASPQANYDAGGHNLYLPVPYAAHCKVTYEHPEPLEPPPAPTQGLYYQVVYRTYDPAAAVTSFSTARLEAQRGLVADVQQRLTESGPGDVALHGTAQASKTLAPGESATLKHGSGSAAIRKLHLKLAADDLPQALRSTVLKISFDGEPTVWVPVGDFFGIGYVPVNHQTWATRATADGDLTAWWVMPFREDCAITVENLGEQPVKIDFDSTRGSYQWTDRSMHFHATWHQLSDVRTQTNEGAENGAFDHNFVTIDGRGVYVGDALTLFNNAPVWWGEGDEKIYVDGEPFPSTFGTGTEDYFGYAWCRPETVANPFHAQPVGDGNLTRGTSVNSRHRLLDAIPFERSLRLDMEIWHWAKTTMNYAPTTFWYAAPGATSNIAPDPKSAALAVRRTPEPFRVAGATEGESLQKVACTGGEAVVQTDGTCGWSDDKQLWWRDGRPGDRLALRPNVPAAGRYHVAAVLSAARDYGIVTLSLAGRSSRPFDGFHPDGVAVKTLDLGVLDLAAGEQDLTVTLVGVNPAAVPRHMFGLDYLKLEPAE